ncbi:MAG: glycosyltransferase family 4 protein, partial [Acidimicrobiia bacterium]
MLHAYCSDIQTPKGPLQSRPSDPEGLRICDLGTGTEFPKYQLARRVIREARYARRFGSELHSFGPDVVLSSNDPPVARLLSIAAARRAHVPVVCWLQDLYALGLSLIFRERLGCLAVAPSFVARALERHALRGCAAVVVIGEEFVAPTQRMVDEQIPVRCIENWAPIEELPALPRTNPLRRRLGLEDDFVFLYSGTLGLKHDPERLLELADRARAWPRTVVVVCSEGPGARHLASAARQRGLDTLRPLDYQPYERLPELLGMADVLCAVLDERAARYAVPSKILTYHTAGRPVLAAIARENSAAKFIARAESGIVVEPADARGWMHAARRLRYDEALRERLGHNARAEAERAFDIDEIVERFQGLLEG